MLQRPRGSRVNAPPVAVTAISAAAPAPAPGNTYANSIATTPTTHARKMLCLSVKRNSLPSSSGVRPVAAQATAMLGSAIILPMTPAAEFTDAVSTGFSPI